MPRLVNDPDLGVYWKGKCHDSTKKDRQLLVDFLYVATGGRVHYVGEVNAPEKLAYTWQWENAFEQMPQTRVTVQFIQRDATTEVLLTHENLSDIAVCLHHPSGWIAAWERMGQIL